MADRSVAYPSVFVVDGHAALPPLPPKPGFREAQKRRNRLFQSTILLLLGMALCGIAVEACFIYDLYTKTSQKGQSNETPKTEKQIGEGQKEEIIPKTRRPSVFQPSKPLAHLIANVKPGMDGIMHWKENAYSDMHDLEYKDGALVVNTEGFYFIYSKVSYNADNNSFHHMVLWDTTRYNKDTVELLRSRRYQTAKLTRKGSVSNSYLGGVFHLFPRDKVFVKVQNATDVLVQHASDNFFGMFML